MTYVLLALVLAFAIGGVVLIFLARHFRARYAAMVSTETATVAELEERRKAAAGAVGTGYLAQVVEVKGIAECEKPLQAELSGRECVLCRTHVTREYEEEEERQDSQGRTERVTIRRSETVAQNEQHTEFWVRDDTGRILVEPDGASLDLTKTVDRFERNPAADGASVTIGGVPINFNVGIGLGSGSRTLGYRYVEEILPVGARLFVLGEVSDAPGRLVMRKPVQSKSPYIISMKSEEELVSAARKWASWTRIGYVASFGITVVLLIVLAGLAVR